MLAFKLYHVVPHVVYAYAELVALVRAVQLFAEGGIVPVVKVQAAYKISAVLFGERIPLHCKRKLALEQGMIAFRNIIFQLVPVSAFAKLLFPAHPNTSAM